MIVIRRKSEIIIKIESLNLKVKISGIPSKTKIGLLREIKSKGAQKQDKK